MDNEKIRIIIADDEPVTKMDLRELLTSAGYQVVAEASDGLDAVELCRQPSGLCPYMTALYSVRIFPYSNLIVRRKYGKEVISRKGLILPQSG